MTKTKNKQLNNIYFNNDEKNLSDYVEKKDLKFLSKKKKEEMLNMLSYSAKNTLSKRKTISLRLSERDLRNFKIKAVEEGMPYQTLMTSILHKHISS